MADVAGVQPAVLQRLGGILGAVVAVPIVAGITVVLGRLQDREVPVPIDPAAIETPSEEA